MPMSPQQFVAQLLELDIVSTATIEVFLERLDENSRNDLRQLIRQMMASGLITRYQTAKILKGQSASLVLGNYLLMTPIGRGGMGVVYQARHRWMERIVALKVLNHRSSDQHALRRFQREVQAAAKLNHPNIVTAFDADESQGRLYLVMEYVPGEDLVTLVKQNGPFPLAKAVSCIIQAAKGLHYAHQQHLVHRDIKPGNMLLDYEGNLKILDMGLARMDATSATSEIPVGEKPTDLTNAQQILGTVDFMSPEQADESASADEQSDIYSLGCTLYYLLTGTTPYPRSSIIQSLLAHRIDPIPPIQELAENIPDGLQAVFEKMVAKSPRDRFASMAEVIKAITPFDDDTDFEVDESLSLMIDEGEDTKVFDFSPQAPSSDNQPPSAVSSRSNPSASAKSAQQSSGTTNALQHPAPTQKTPLAVGIDLGTTYTVVSYIDPNGVPQTIPNAEGELLTPSTVYFSPHRQVLVGRDAVAALATDPQHVAEHAKRAVGIQDQTNSIYGQDIPPEVLLAAVLKKIKRDAEARLGPFEEVVITVPAYFDETRRLATQNAGFLAGLKVIDIVNEPTAAALAYGIQRTGLSQTHQVNPDQNILVYDLGGGTFDATVLSYSDGSFRALATDGDVELGGIDWDNKLVAHVLKEIQSQTKIDLSNNPLALTQLRLECERAKRHLSQEPTSFVNCTIGDKPFTFELTRKAFERVSADLLARTEYTTKQVVQNSNLHWKNIDRILLVGGSTRMPAVAEMLTRISGIKPELTDFPDEIVSHGAAVHAESIHLRKAGDRARINIRNVNSHSLGVTAMNPRTRKLQTSVLIPKNTPLPATATRIYRIRNNSQRQIVIPIVEGESPDPNACSPLGRCILSGLPEDLPQDSEVEVRFTYRQNGRLSLKVKVDGKPWEQRLQRYAGLPNRDLLKWKSKLDGNQLYDSNEFGFAELE